MEIKFRKMNKRKAIVILLSIILGIPAVIFSLCFIILRIVGESFGESVNGAVALTIGSLYIIYQIWKDSPLNFYGERKKKIMRENLETWNRLHRRECRKIDKETEREIMRDDYHGPTSNPNAAGYLGSNPFGGFGC